MPESRQRGARFPNLQLTLNMWLVSSSFCNFGLVILAWNGPPVWPLLHKHMLTCSHQSTPRHSRLLFRTLFKNSEIYMHSHKVSRGSSKMCSWHTNTTSDFRKQNSVTYVFNSIIPYTDCEYTVVGYLWKHFFKKQKDTCTPVFVATLFTIARTWKQPKCPMTDE